MQKGMTTFEKNPETLNIHSGTKDLTASCKTQTYKVILSSIKQRHEKFDQKVYQANKHLKEECDDRYICLIDHRNISSKLNCNRSGLH